jgi:hypothetical protein
VAAPSESLPSPSAANTDPPPTSSWVPPVTPPPAPPDPSCAAKDRPWPTNLHHRRTLAAFRDEPRDETWAREAEAHLKKYLGGADDALRVLECRRSACVVGCVEDRDFAERVGGVLWSGPTPMKGLRAPDSCRELLTIFWRFPLDYPGAPGGRLSSMKKLQCAGSRPDSADANCRFRGGGLCFDKLEPACRCACSVLPGASRTRPFCVTAGYHKGMGCDAPEPEFGMPWPPPRGK